MPSPGDIASPTDLAAYEDGNPAWAVRAATAKVRDHCGWHITPALVDDVVTLDGSGGPYLNLPSMYVTAVSGILENGVPLDPPPTGFQWSDKGVLWRSSWWLGDYRAYEVTFSHGYAESSREADTVRNIILAVAARTRTGGPGGMVRQVGQIAYATPSLSGAAAELLAQEIADLAPYTLHNRP